MSVILSTAHGVTSKLLQMCIGLPGCTTFTSNKNYFKKMNAIDVKWSGTRNKLKEIVHSGVFDSECVFKITSQAI